MEAMGSELNVFEPILNHTAMIGEIVQEFAPLAKIIHGAPMDFQIGGSEGNYTDLNNSKLKGKVKLTRPTGAHIADSVNVSTVNVWLHSLFQTMRMKIPNQVTESNSLYRYRSLFGMLLNYEAEGMKTRLMCEGFEEDTGLGDTNPPTAGKNTGLNAREVKFNYSRCCD